jgi:cobalamin synthase
MKKILEVIKKSIFFHFDKIIDVFAVLFYILMLFASFIEAKEVSVFWVILYNICVILYLVILMKKKRDGKLKESFSRPVSYGWVTIIFIIVLLIIAILNHRWNLFVIPFLPGLAFVLDKYTKHLPRKK